MVVKSTDVKNNFGRYLKILDGEDIIITKNGVPVARMEKYDSFEEPDRVMEQSTAYNIDRQKMTFEEFMDFYENTEDRYEYIDGEVYMLSSPKVTHQQVLGTLFMSMYEWSRGKKCRPFMAPFDVMLKKEGNMNVVQPDILVVCDPENRNEKDKYTGTPSLVVEIVSECTRSKDVIKKMDLYMRSGVREYWIVDYFNRGITVYAFENNDIKAMKSFVRDDTVRSFIFEGLAVKLPDVFE